MRVFNIYITDLYCRELNYNYITRFNVKANTVQGAVGKVARYVGLNFRKHYDEVYHSTSKVTGLVIEFDPYDGSQYDDAITI